MKVNKTRKYVHILESKVSGWHFTLIDCNRLNQHCKHWVLFVECEGFVVFFFSYRYYFVLKSRINQHCVMGKWIARGRRVRFTLCAPALQPDYRAHYCVLHATRVIYALRSSTTILDLRTGMRTAMAGSGWELEFIRRHIVLTMCQVRRFPICNL